MYRIFRVAVVYEPSLYGKIFILKDFYPVMKKDIFFSLFINFVNSRSGEFYERFINLYDKKLKSEFLHNKYIMKIILIK